MPILKPMITGNGNATAARLEYATLRRNIPGTDLNAPPGLEIQLSLFKTIDGLRNNSDLLWQLYYNLPVDAYDPLDPIGSIEKFVIAHVPDFAGGLYEPEVPVSDLDTAKRRRWATIKGEREAAEQYGFESQGLGFFDTNTESRTKIIGAALAAKTKRDESQPFQVEWTLRDNTNVTLNADQTIALGFEMFAYLDATHQHSRQLFTQIQDATTVEEVNAINW